MGELFETLFSLIPIALIIALRIVMSKKKKAEAEEKNKLIAFLSKQGMKTAPGSGVPVRPLAQDEVGVAPRGHWENEENAWNKDYPGEFEGDPHLVSNSKNLARPHAPAPQPVFVTAPPRAWAAARESDTLLRPVERGSEERASAPLSKHLGGLSELQRAVVLTEILGHPRGLG